MSQAGSTDRLTQARAALVAAGGTFVDLPILLPASLVLELAGEGLRPRLFFVTPPEGGELCLRPDLTIPAVVRYCGEATYDNAPVAWACQGPVFRAAKPGEARAAEFTQIGLERFGDADVIATDVAIFVAAWRAVAMAGDAPLHVRFCDGGLLPHVLAQAQLPDIWRDALREQVSHSRAFLALLNEAGAHKSTHDLGDIDRALIDMSPEAAIAHVAGILDQQGLSLTQGRTMSDIARRLVTKAKRALAPPLPEHCVAALLELARFRQTTHLTAALDQIVTLAQPLGVNLSQWRDDWATRLEAIAEQAPDALQHCRLDALGEEAFDYYDGMAFDISQGGDFTKPLATGGRYDRLIGDISGGARHARAIGCVIRPDRFDVTAAHSPAMGPKP